jgi:L-histidine N-alpha-methyltransferase
LATAERTSITELSSRADIATELDQDIREGLLVHGQKSLPPKYFYDGQGSALFEKITELPEYYPTRAETEILERVAYEVVGALAPRDLVELGSGSARKTRLLLEAMHKAGGTTYVPLDVSRDAVLSAADELTRDYPWLRVDGYIGDFHTDLHRIPRPAGSRLVAFLGSTIGNFPTALQLALLAEVRRMLAPGDRFLLGADLVKPRSELVAAYDDDAGVTAAFNRNMLVNVNAIAGSDFDPDDFDHEAFWNEGLSCIEMRLVARTDVKVHFPRLDTTVSFSGGEHLLTEHSCKFTRERINAIAEASGMRVERWETDDAGRFALALMAPL